MALLLTAQDVMTALPYPLAIEALEQGFRAFAAGSYVFPQRLVLSMDHGLLAAMPAVGKGFAGIKVATVHTRNTEIGLPAVQAIVVLIDEGNGSVLSIMDGTSLTVTRTAAASAIATQHMSNQDPVDLGVLGSGPLAIGHIRAIAVVRPLRRVRVYSPNALQRWNDIVNQLAGLAVDIEPAGSAREVVTNSNLLVLATSSTEPILEWNWVIPGTHINAVGSHSPTARELDTESVVHGRLICDSVDACWAEAGDLLIPHAQGRIDRSHTKCSLGDVLLGRIEGRQTQEQVTIFKSVGLAFQDLCAGLAVWDRAKKLGLGVDWSTD